MFLDYVTKFRVSANAEPKRHAGHLLAFGLLELDLANRVHITGVIFIGRFGIINDGGMDLLSQIKIPGNELAMGSWVHMAGWWTNVAVAWIAGY